MYFCVAKSFTTRSSYSIDVRVCVDGGGGRAEQVPVPTDGIKPVGTFPHTWTRGQFRVSPKSISTSSCVIATGATGRVDTIINTIALIEKTFPMCNQSSHGKRPTSESCGSK